MKYLKTLIAAIMIAQALFALNASTLKNDKSLLACKDCE